MLSFLAIDPIHDSIHSVLLFLALQALCEFLPCVGERIGAGLPTLVPALLTSLGSGNERVRQVAGNAVAALTNSSPSVQLVPVLCHALLNSSSTRGKVTMLGRLADMAPGIYKASPSLIAKHVLPCVGGLLVEARGELKVAVGDALAVAAQLLGGQLQDQLDVLAPQVAARIRDFLQLPG